MKEYIIKNQPDLADFLNEMEVPATFNRFFVLIELENDKTLFELGIGFQMWRDIHNKRNRLFKPPGDTTQK